MERECRRYGLDVDRVAASMQGDDPLSKERGARRWWEWAVFAAAVGVFVRLASGAERQPVSVNAIWMAVLITASLAFLIAGGVLLWKRTRFS